VRIRLLIFVAALGPAALFGVSWRLLNSDFSPYVGEGIHSKEAAFTAGLCFYFWLLSLTKHCRSLRSLPAQGKTAYWSFLLALAAVPGGRLLFSILPPWDNGFGGVIATVVAFALVRKHFAADRTRFSHDRGTVMLSEADGRRELERLPQGSEPRIRWAGIDLPGEVARGNILAVGAIGTGKTRLHRELLRSVVQSITPDSDRRILFYDVKCDLLSELAEMNPRSEVLVFNPFDRRSVAWDVAADVRTPEQARHFADAFVPPAKGNDKEFFSNAAKAILAGSINRLNERCAGRWNLRDLIRVTASKDRLRELLRGTDLVEQFFSPPDTFANVCNTIANVTVELEPVAALWERTPQKISLRQWVKSGSSILVLGGKENLQAALEPLNRIAFKVISTEFLSERESPNRSRLWFFCDELKTAGRLDNLPLLLNARSKGVRSVLGFQDLEGLIDAYGSKEKALEVASRCATAAILRLTSTDTAEWASKRTGEFERFEYFETQTKDGTNIGEHLTKREAVLPSEFLTLPDFAEGTRAIAGIHLIRGLKGVFRSSTQAHFPKGNDVPDFDPRNEGEQVLAPWSVEDARRLGLHDDDDNAAGGPVSAGPRPDEPDLSSLGRVSFGS